MIGFLRRAAQEKEKNIRILGWRKKMGKSLLAALRRAVSLILILKSCYFSPTPIKSFNQKTLGRVGLTIEFQAVADRFLTLLNALSKTTQ